MKTTTVLLESRPLFSRQVRWHTMNASDAFFLAHHCGRDSLRQGVSQIPTARELDKKVARDAYSDTEEISTRRLITGKLG